MATLTHGLKTLELSASAWREILNDNFTALDSNRILSGTYGSIPSAGTAGRFYYATDTRALFYDDGSNWKIIVSDQVRSVSSTGNINADDRLILGTGGGGGITLTLPLAANTEGQVVTVKKVDAAAGAVGISAGGSDTINDGVSTSVSLASQGNRTTLISDGVSEWQEVG